MGTGRKNVVFGIGNKLTSKEEQESFFPMKKSSHQEIASQLDISEKAVENILVRQSKSSRKGSGIKK